MHAILESHKTNTDSLDEALNVSWKEVAATKGILEDQRARLDAVGAEMAALKNFQGKSSASTATFREKQIQVERNLATALEMKKASSAHSVAMPKERETGTTKFKEMHSYVEQCFGFANKRMACLDPAPVKVVRERKVNVTKANRLSHEAQYVQGQADDAKKSPECVSVFETAARVGILNGAKSPAARLKPRKADVEAKLALSLVDLDAWSARVMESMARAIALDRQPEKSASQVRAFDSKYSLLYDKAQMLKQGLAKGVSCDGELQ